MQKKKVRKVHMGRHLITVASSNIFAKWNPFHDVKYPSW